MQIEGAKHVEVIGDAVLILGDCLEVMPHLGKVDLVLADQPYEGLKGNVRHTGRGERSVCETVADPWDANTRWLEIAWERTLRGMMVFTSWQGAASTFNALPGEPCGLQVWQKPNAKPPRNNVPPQDCELIWCTRRRLKGIEPLNWRALDRGVFQCDFPVAGIGATERILRCDSMKAAHPAQKPLMLIKWLLLVRPASVLDPFMGTGTTAEACLGGGIPSVSIERDPDFFEIAVKRLSKAARRPHQADFLLSVCSEKGEADD